MSWLLCKLKIFLDKVIEFPVTVMGWIYKDADAARKAYVKMEEDPADSEAAREYKRLMNMHSGYFYGRDLQLIKEPRSDEEYQENIAKIQRYDEERKPIRAFNNVAEFIIYIIWFIFIGYVGLLIIGRIIVLAIILFLLAFGFIMGVIPRGSYDPLILNLIDELWTGFWQPSFFPVWRALFRR